MALVLEASTLWFPDYILCLSISALGVMTTRLPKPGSGPSCMEVLLKETKNLMICSESYKKVSRVGQVHIQRKLNLIL